MKKLTILLIAIFLIAQMAIPALAADVCFPRYEGDSGSLVDALKAIGEEATSFSARTRIAAANGIPADMYCGSAEQNLYLLARLKEGTLVDPDAKATETVAATEPATEPTQTPTSTPVSHMAAQATAATPTQMSAQAVPDISAFQTTKGTAGSSVQVETAGLYRVKTNTKLRTGTMFWSGTYAVAKKDAILQISGKTGNYYTVTLNGTKYYVKKADLEKAPATSTASLYYTTSAAPLRKAPDKHAAKTTVPSGTLLPCIGKIEHKNNNWLVIFTSDGIRFMFSGNTKAASALSLEISGESMVAVGNETTLICRTSPNGLAIEWSSSDNSVATVDANGTVKTLSPGTVTITASVGKYLQAAFTVTSFEYAVFPARTLNVTQIGFENYSHGAQNAIDLVSSDRLVAPFLCKVAYTDERWGYVILQSVYPVLFADGSYDYATVSLMHDENIRDLYVGQIIAQGTPMYDQGGWGKGQRLYGDHVHLAVWRGHVPAANKYGAGNMFVFDMLFVDGSITASVKNPGKAVNRVYNDAPTDYSGLWRYIN